MILLLFNLYINVYIAGLKNKNKTCDLTILLFPWQLKHKEGVDSCPSLVMSPSRHECGPVHTLPIHCQPQDSCALATRTGVASQSGDPITIRVSELAPFQHRSADPEGRTQLPTLPSRAHQHLSLKFHQGARELSSHSCLTVLTEDRPELHSVRADR